MQKNSTQQEKIIALSQNLATIENEMYVKKRNGDIEPIDFNKIKRRIDKMCSKFEINDINRVELCIKVIDQLHNNISTSQIDELTAQQCATSSAKHPSFGVLAKAIIISNYQKNTLPSFVDVVNTLHTSSDILDPSFVSLVNFHKETYESMIDDERDFLIDYFGFKTLERAYLLKNPEGKPIERIQHMFLRVAIQIHKANMALVKETYDLMSTKHFIHATPTMFNSGLHFNQLSSCFLLALEDDSLEGIFDTLKDCAKISKWAGGIGLHISNLRARNSIIRSTHGRTNGLVPMLRVFNDTSKFINQGGKRNGSYAIYLEPWHADVLEFLEMRKNHGDEECKARDLFYGLWIPDLFMERVIQDGDWSLFCPTEAPGLQDVYGDSFVHLYTEYERASSPSLARKTMKARDLWKRILDAQMETGTPYILYKDACNRKSNQKNLGTIKSSNLCTEIIEYSDENETAVCNLASIALPSCVNAETQTFDHAKLHQLTRVLTRNLNEIIDVNFYPTQKTKRSNKLHRPIGIGVQGLADTFCMMNLAFESSEAKDLNRRIFETIYHGALQKSMEMVQERNEALLEYFQSQLLLVNEEKKEEMELLFVLESYKREEKITLKHKLETLFLEQRETWNLIYIPFLLISLIVNSNSNQEEYYRALTQEMLLQELEEEREADRERESCYEMHQEHQRKEKEEINSFEFKNFKNNSCLSSLFCEEGKLYINDKEFRFIFLEAWNVFQRMRIALQLNLIELIPKIWNQIGAYSSFADSPSAEGILQFDLWQQYSNSSNPQSLETFHYDWDALKEQIKNSGLRNSLLIAPMPTASTSQILGFNECFEPFTSNIYSRRTLAGEFIVLNRYLMRELIEMNVWNDTIRQSIIAAKGSIAHLTFLPEAFRNKYKIVWEMSMKNLIDMSADRGAFICQSQSLNLWQENPNQNSLSSMHVYAYRKGLKTGIYYLRRKARHQAQQFTIDPTLAENLKKSATGGETTNASENESTETNETKETTKEKKKENSSSDEEEPCESCSA